ncbi:hypothetical protein PMAYCL1PPCAC_33258, partial [Pristionchus mayeri]
MIRYILVCTFLACISAAKSLPFAESVYDSDSIRSCAIDCFAKNRLPFEPQSKNKTYFEDVKRDYYTIDGVDIQTSLSYRGPRDSDFIHVFYQLRRNSSITIDLEGKQIDVIFDPRHRRSCDGSESMLAAFRRRQTTCIWNCYDVENKLRGKWRRGEEVSILNQSDSYDRWTLDSIGVDVWLAIVSSTYQ